MPARLSDLDHEILGLVSEMRVVTQTQIDRLHSDVPSRTLRYRTRRLHELGLLGRTRPYREAGSAPHHLWPTRRADALVRGEPPPRRGERHAPSPLSIAHSAALTEALVVLATRAADAGLRFERVLREADARESFAGPAGRERAIAPDLLAVLRDADGDRLLLAHVEVDLGTISHARLRTKLERYVEYADRRAWTARHEFLPALLFITTSRQRAETFARTATRLTAKARESRYGEPPVIGVCARARHMDGIATARCWAIVGEGGPVALREVLNAARRGLHQHLAAEARQTAARDALRRELEGDARELRAHLRDHRGLRRSSGLGSTVRSSTCCLTVRVG